MNYKIFIFQFTAPKKESFDKAQELLNQQLAELKKKQQELDELTDKLEELYKKMWSKQLEQQVN